ncbi:PEP-CTERM sorting domain-containing protein [Thalassotalea piscium]
MKKIILALTLASSFFAVNSYAGKILLTQFDNNSGFQLMETNLENAGHTVDIIDATVTGNIASALNTGLYDQVFLWDLTSRLFLDSNDISALSNFWSTNMGIAIDTRSYGHHFQGTDASEVALIQNIAHNLELSGGGLWIGSDHAPGWSHNSNALLSALGFDLITGQYSDPVNYADPTSVLLNGVTPADLWGGGESLGKAPVGLQSNGVEMFAHFGNTNGQSTIPYISASFDLTGPVPTQSVPEPTTLAIFAFGIMGLLSRRLSK